MSMVDQYPVRTGIPAPINSSRSRYPLELLKIGNHFDVPFSDVKTCTFLPPYERAKSLGIKIMSRRVDREGVYRIWRIA